MSKDRREYNRAYYAANKDKFKEYAAANKRRTSDWHLTRKYGITSDQRDEMLEKQDFKCAICADTSPGGRGTWHVDHCHTSGKVRGLLCYRCNQGLGYFRDNTEFLDKAKEYLKGHDPR